MSKHKKRNCSAFFENENCEYYPCHKGLDEINCLFCYCPWFWKCKYKDDGASCPDCVFIHKREMYPYVIQGLREMYEEQLNGEQHADRPQQEQVRETDNSSDNN